MKKSILTLSALFLLVGCGDGKKEKEADTEEVTIETEVTEVAPGQEAAEAPALEIDTDTEETAE